MPHAIRPRLDRLFDCLENVRRRCPEGCNKRLPLNAIILHLNDDHHWTREQIVDWLEIVALRAAHRRPWSRAECGNPPAMPELPDVVVYLEALTRHIAGHRLERLHLHSPFVLRTVDPPIDAIAGRTRRRRAPHRQADRRCAFEDDLFLVIHLMIAGRLRWREPGEEVGHGAEADPRVVRVRSTARCSSPRRARRSARRCSWCAARRRCARSIPAASSRSRPRASSFTTALTRESHTLKRALTDPHLFSGIGNAYSDEILHAARLSPLKLTRSLTDEEFGASVRRDARDADAVDRAAARSRPASGFPEKVTAFHDEMAVHGRFRQPCPVCGTPVQRIVYADNECNYCAACQTGGRLLADRSLSRLLKDDWPRSIDEV